MGRGALASESGVGLLSRSINSATFDADGLRDAFSDLAHEFNLPIEQVVQGAYGMTKVFQDQNQALEATKAVLFAVKVGELDADTSTRALTATINGFGLSADSLVDVMDAVDNAQNKLGGNTGQLVLGMAKSAGAARNAGLDFRQLIAILATGSRLTGQTGEQVGTAVGRSISVLQTPAGQARAKAAGLDPLAALPRRPAPGAAARQGPEPRARAGDRPRAGARRRPVRADLRPAHPERPAARQGARRHQRPGRPRRVGPRARQGAAPAQRAAGRAGHQSGARRREARAVRRPGPVRRARRRR